MYKAKSIVLATGAMGRPPGFKGEGEYLGRGVSYCATCDGAFYRDEEVAVVGIGKEAVDEAMYLTKFAKCVHWITQGEGPGGEEAEELRNMPNVKQWTKTRLVEVLGDGNEVTSVEVKQFASENEEVIPVLGCFIYVAGSKPITDFIQSKDVRFNPDGGVWVDDEMSTSVPGVYAIGDIRNTPFKQVRGGGGEKDGSLERSDSSMSPTHITNNPPARLFAPRPSTRRFASRPSSPHAGCRCS